MLLTPSLASLLTDYTVIIVPGLRNSDERHWQSKWCSQLPESLRVTLPEWETPDLAKWQHGIREQLRFARKPVVLIAHSFGTLASASLANDYAAHLAGLFLVAPADPDKFGISDRLPASQLVVPTTLISSTNDPWLTAEKAYHLAAQWNAKHVQLNNVGHINSDSHLGEWLEGQEQLALFITSLSSTRSLAA